MSGFFDAVSLGHGPAINLLTDLILLRESSVTDESVNKLATTLDDLEKRTLVL